MVFESLVVRHDEQCGSRIGGLFAQQVQDDLGVGVIERTRGLVGENNRWFAHERSRYGYTLLFTARKLMREVV